MLPLPDPNRTKLSDDDELYRILISDNWQVKAAEKHVRARYKWREEIGIAGLYEWVAVNVRDDIQRDYPHGFCGTDVEGHPVYWERPDPRGVERLLQRYSRDTFTKYHIYMMERARELMRLLHTDRYTIVQDVSQMTLGFIASPISQSGAFLRSQARMDQKQYPEMFRWFFMVRAPSSFTAVFKLMNPLLDPRVAADMFVLGEDFSEGLAEKVPLDQTPAEFGGCAPTAFELCALHPFAEPLDLSRMPAYAHRARNGPAPDGAASAAAALAGSSPAPAPAPAAPSSEAAASPLMAATPPSSNSPDTLPPVRAASGGESSSPEGVLPQPRGAAPAEGGASSRGSPGVASPLDLGPSPASPGFYSPAAQHQRLGADGQGFLSPAGDASSATEPFGQAAGDPDLTPASLMSPASPAELPRMITALGSDVNTAGGSGLQSPCASVPASPSESGLPPRQPQLQLAASSGGGSPVQEASSRTRPMDSTARGSTSIVLGHLDGPDRDRLRVLDHDGDGVVGAADLAAVCARLRELEAEVARQHKHLQRQKGCGCCNVS